MRMIDLHNDDCLAVLKSLPDNSVNLVITSPPYAEQRRSTYNSISTENYIEWFLPIAIEIKRVLTADGSFFLNIKSHVENGNRHLYTYKLLIALTEEVDFNFIDEFCWEKIPFPGKFQGRLKNAFEPIYHFTKSHPKHITFNPTACGDFNKYTKPTKKKRNNPASGSEMSVNNGNMVNVKIARPSNLIYAPNTDASHDSKLKGKHSATYPTKLVEFFIKTFSNEDDVVLDPFMGSGTTGVVAKSLNRNFIGAELKPEYFAIAEQMIDEAKMQVTKKHFDTLFSND